ncbi:MAG: indolepyruvate ferredoxin oxidoreductase family protein [Pseudomonadota bacterium]
MDIAALRPYELADNLRAESGVVWLTGTQALVRLLLMQRQRDAAKGWRTAGFVSGYRGSPLGMVDQQMWKAHPLLQAAGVEFLPAINEDLAATACLGTQRVALDPERRVDGVFALWYGKGPGVDRSGDALKHGNVYGSSPKGGVLVVCGDDHGCVSSSMPHQSDLALAHFGMPVLHPANVAEYLEFGLYGWALSRYSGAWVGFKAISEVVESGMTVDLDAVPGDFTQPVPSGVFSPTQNLHVRSVDLPSLTLEARAAEKLDAVRAFARFNAVDKHVVVSPRATLGIVTVGKAHFDFMEVLRRLDLDPNALAAAGVRVYKVGLVWPLEPTRIVEFAQGLQDILVIEEKAPVVERQMKELLYALPGAQRPRVAGKTAPEGGPLIPALGELRPSRIMPVVADWLASLNPALDRRARVVDFTMPSLLSNGADAVRRQPYFCSGCPHSTSTRVPEGSRALAGIGCHFMASWMERHTEGLIQMGAEGVDWVAASRFTDVPHVFQNLGDGTYFHSGLLAIRQAVAAGARITYKILYNDAVAMTGGQAVDGQLSVAEIARQVHAEGAKRVAIVSDDITPHVARAQAFPRGTSFHDRSDLDAVQRELRECEGVTLLIYDQTCAAEKRRRRKTGQLPDVPRRVFINPAVCEGCGDCGAQSNCLSIVPLDTDWGRKRAIDQSSCNKDFRCVDGLCPSFVTLEGAELARPAARRWTEHDLAREVAALAAPDPWRWSGPCDMLVTGVGGTGVVTVGALVAMAAHLEGFQASVLDFMGFAQKGGSVLSFVRIAPTPDLLNQVRIDTQQADLLLACDLVVGASAEALGTVKHGRTEIIANRHELVTAAFVRQPDAAVPVPELVAKLDHAAGSDRVRMLDAQAIAQALLGDTLPANIVMLGAAWQAGLVPVSLAALERAIALNGVAVAQNLHALSLGRLAIVAPQALQRLAGGASPAVDLDELDGPDGLIARRRRFLTDYQDAKLADRHHALVQRVREAEQALGGKAALDLDLTRAVARQYARLLAVKDEYEVARLHLDPAFDAALRQQFARWDRIVHHLAPPLLSRPGADGRQRKRPFGPWVRLAFRLLVRLKGLRGSVLDPFGHTQERRMERELARDYEVLITAELLPALRAENQSHAVRLANVVQQVRGFGAVKLASHTAARTEWQTLLEVWRGGGGAEHAPPAPQRMIIPVREIRAA